MEMLAQHWLNMMELRGSTYTLISFNKYSTMSMIECWSNL